MSWLTVKNGPPNDGPFLLLFYGYLYSEFVAKTPDIHYAINTFVLQN
ncbi:hypothetical protein [Bacillus sp. THAF10]|nr:hypothetical protein [Bacillus sp. THAF10]